MIVEPMNLYIRADTLPGPYTTIVICRGAPMCAPWVIIENMQAQDLRLFYFQEVQFNWGFPAKEIHHHTDF